MPSQMAQAAKPSPITESNQPPVQQSVGETARSGRRRPGRRVRVPHARFGGGVGVELSAETFLDSPGDAQSRPGGYKDETPVDETHLMVMPTDPSIPKAPHPIPEEIWSGTPNVVLDGRRYAIGWQRFPAGKGGPAYVTVRRGFLGGHRVLERYPLTDDGWSVAWRAFARLDPAAARKTRAVLAGHSAAAPMEVTGFEWVPPIPAYWSPPPYRLPPAYGTASPYLTPPRPSRRKSARTLLIVTACCALIAFWLFALYVYANGGYLGPTGNLAYETKLAVSQPKDGQFTIYELACLGEWVQEVDLKRWNDNTGPGATLWQIRSSGRTAVYQFTVGTTPPGFRTVRHLTAALKPGEAFQAYMVLHWKGMRGTFSLPFYPRDARRNSLYLGVGPNYVQPKSYSAVYASLAEFRSARGLVCKNQRYPVIPYS